MFRVAVAFVDGLLSAPTARSVDNDFSEESKTTGIYQKLTFIVWASKYTGKVFRAAYLSAVLVKDDDDGGHDL